MYFETKNNVVSGNLMDCGETFGNHTLRKKFSSGRLKINLPSVRQGSNKKLNIPFESESSVNKLAGRQLRLAMRH